MWKKLLREKPLFVLALVTILYFYRPIFLGEVFYFRDLYAHFVPIKKLVAELIARYELPLWNPYLQGGSPLLANPNNMVLYPSNFLYLWIPAHRALTIEIIVHLFAGAAGVYAFCRLILFSRISSLIAGIVFGFCGYAMSTLNFVNWLTASAYLPIVFCFYHLYFLQQKKRWWILLILSASLQVFAGAPEITFITFSTLLIWTLFYPYPYSAVHKVLRWFIVAIFTAGLSLIQILPSIELSRASIRSIGFGFDSSTAWSIHPYRMMELIFPGILGRVDSLSPGAFWGQSLEGNSPYFLSIYFGLPAFALACLGAFSGTRTDPIPRSLRRALFLMILALIFFSTARYLPGVSALYEMFSLRVPFRYPVKLIAAMVFPMCLLVASGSNILFDRADGSMKYRLLFWSLSGLLLFLLIVFYFSTEVFERFARLIFDRDATDLMRDAWIQSILHAFAMWTALCLLRETNFKWKQQALAGVLLADLLLAGIPLKIFGSANLYTVQPQLVSILKKEIGSGKLFRTPNTPENQLRAPDDDIFWSFQWHQETLSGHLASNYSIPVIFHDDQDASSLMEINYMRLVLGPLPWEKRMPLLSAAGVNFILTSEQLNVSGLHPKAEVQSMGSLPLYLYFNQDAVKTPAFYSRRVAAKDGRDVLKKMTAADFDPARDVVLQTSLESSTQECGPFQPQEVAQSSRRRVFKVETRCHGYLLFSDPAYPGWQVLVDGESKPLIRANFFYFAAPVSPGTHQIEELYSPGSVRVGLILSGFFLFLIFLTPKSFVK